MLEIKDYKELADTKNPSSVANMETLNANSSKKDNLFCNLYDLLVQHLTSNDIEAMSTICGKLFNLISTDHSLSHCIDSKQKCAFFLTLLNSTEFIESSFSPLLLISSILGYNNISIRYFEECGIMEKLSEYLSLLTNISEEQIFIPFSRLVLSCLQTILCFDSEIRNAFIESGDLSRVVALISFFEAKQEYLSETYIGFIFSSVVESITYFEESPFFEPFIDFTRHLLDHQIYDAAFCLIDKLMYFAKTFEILMQMQITTQIFDSWPNVIEMFRSLLQEDSDRKNDHDLNRIVNNALIILQQMLENIQTHLDISHFPLNELFEIALSEHRKFSKIALHVILLYCRQSMDNVIEIFEMPFINIMFQTLDSIDFNTKLSFCRLLVYLLNNIPVSSYSQINEEVILFVIDFIDAGMDELLESTGQCLIKLIDNGFDFHFLFDEINKIQERMSESEEYGNYFHVFLNKLSSSEENER